MQSSFFPPTLSMPKTPQSSSEPRSPASAHLSIGKPSKVNFSFIYHSYRSKVDILSQSYQMPRRCNKCEGHPIRIRCEHTKVGRMYLQSEQRSLSDVENEVTPVSFSWLLLLKTTLTKSSQLLRAPITIFLFLRPLVASLSMPYLYK